MRAQENGWARVSGSHPGVRTQLSVLTSQQQQKTRGVFSCQSFLKQLCSEAYAGLTSEGNFLFGEVEAKEFPVWADRAS